MMARGLGQFTAQAVVPEQLSVYVAALSGRTALACGSCIAYVGDRDLVLVGYPPHDPHDLAAVDEAIVRARRLPVLARGGRLTVLCPARPHTVPDHATVREDCWFGIELPVPPPKQKLRNMLRRGQRAVRIDQNSKNFSAAHQALVEEHIRRHSLAPDLAGIYARLPAFLAASPQAVLFSAYSLDDHALVACAVGEYAGLHTAFYLFAFRSDRCPPGVADALLAAVLREAEARGHARCNLGLGINSGVGFFKRKWQARPFLPYREYSWTVPDAGAARPPTPQQAAPSAPGIWARLRDGLFRPKSPERPLAWVQVEISSVCAARCAYCPQSSHRERWQARRMDAATFAALQPLFRRSRRVHLQGWGEPLLHPLFFNFTTLAIQAGCQVSSTSCGLRIDEQTARALAQSGMDILAFSLAGTDEHSNAVRQGAPFAEVCESIARVRRACREEGADHLQLHCAYILLADRMAAVLELPDLMARLGLDAAVVSTLDYVSTPEHAALAFAPHEQEKIARARDLLQQAAARADRLGLRFSYGLPRPEPWGTCREEVEHSLYVDAEGALSPCIYLNVPTGEPAPHRRVFGKAGETDAFACWQGQRFAAFRAALASGRPEPPCIACAKRFEKIE